jgi:hypothetical protein
MPSGPGKYDDLCTQVRDAADARVAFVLIIGGDSGSGFALQQVASDNDRECVANLLAVADRLCDCAAMLTADAVRLQRLIDAGQSIAGHVHSEVYSPGTPPERGPKS